MRSYLLHFLLVFAISGLSETQPAFAQQPLIDEATIESNNKRFEAEAKVKAPCAMPQVSESAKIVLLRIDHAEAFSTVTIGSQDVATKTGAIDVESGGEPLYLIVVGMGPTIWRLTGAVERIERLVLAAMTTGPNRAVPGETPLTGAAGIAPGRVAFLRHPHCLSMYERISTWSKVAPSIVKYEMGRGPATGAAFREISRVSVPSLTWQSGRSKSVPMVAYDKGNSGTVIEGDPTDQIILKGQNDLDEELKLFTPGGVTDVDANAVVASQPVERYEVLPQQAGLLQLLRSDALSRDAKGDFIIRRKIRLPADLSGGHRFLLPPGVPEPDGESGHVCIMVEETGAPLKGSRC
jgi:hypothetical protein